MRALDARSRRRALQKEQEDHHPGDRRGALVRENASNATAHLGGSTSAPHAVRMTSLRVARYVEQRAYWPTVGRHLLAQFDERGVVVYQAYRPSIAAYAVEHQRFGVEFGFTRMSWIKPGYLWMMFRSGWATKENQERVLAVTIERVAFDAFLGAAVASSFIAELYASPEAWLAVV